jgi:hypothetical protein
VASSLATSGEKMPDYKSTGATLLTNSTPVADGFYFPAEWQPHEYTIMVPPPPQNWKGYGIPLSDVREQWADVANRQASWPTPLNKYEDADYVSGLVKRKPFLTLQLQTAIGRECF